MRIAPALTKKLTMLKVYQYMGIPNKIVFMWVDCYPDGRLDFASVRREIDRNMGQGWMWYQGWPENDFTDGAV